MSLRAVIVEHHPLDGDIFLLGLECAQIARQARPGQFIMLRVGPGPEPLLPRPFSIHDAQGDQLWLLYRVVGKGTRLLSQAALGQELALWGPLGSGFDLEGGPPLLVGGGMGAAPLLLAARALAARGQAARVLLGVPSRQGWEETLAHLDARLSELGAELELASEDGSAGRPGLVTSLLPEGEPIPPVAACGPLPMLKALAAWCASREVPCSVSLEAPMACGLGACLGCVLPASTGGYLRVCSEGPVLPAGRVDWERL